MIYLQLASSNQIPKRLHEFSENSSEKREKKNKNNLASIRSVRDHLSKLFVVKSTNVMLQAEH